MSVVIPVFNEEESIRPLYSKIINELESFDAEIIFINDGSSDKTRKNILEIIESDNNVFMIDFMRNFGKAAGLSEAFKIANGDIIVTIDGDLQDDPSEIGTLISKINSGWDLVSGWKKDRKDPIMKILASRLFNMITRLKTGIKIHDFNCGLKAYKRNVVKTIKIYGHLHRFIPVLAHFEGFRVTEVKVNHFQREFGHSKYGKSRFFHGFYDFLTIVFLEKYLNRPMHFFGRFGLLFCLSGFLINLYLAVQWIYFRVSPADFDGDYTIIRPLFFLGILLIVVGIQFFSTGFIGEMIVRKTERSSPGSMQIISKEAD
ncbi:MAG: glycosyltransferase [Candidatus Marinimicrobia bacterium]|nr:glycosyltransferase [Candidatus Neomarinimicrobiota bacterium]